MQAPVMLHAARSLKSWTNRSLIHPGIKERAYQLVEDCLRTAILARGLERPRNEVESRFEQANRLAKDLGYPQQLLRIAYNRAWTAYWWYEDYSAFNGFYEEVEMYVKDSAQA